MNTSYIFRILLLTLIPYGFLFSSVLEIPLDEKNKDLFYLNNTSTSYSGSFIDSANDLLDSSVNKDYQLITFEKNEPFFQDITLVKDAVAQKKSGLFFSKKSTIDIPFNRLLSNGLIIDFWLKPLSTLKGNIFLMEYFSPNALTKHISIFFENGHLKVEFSNMFSDSLDFQIPKTLTLLSHNKVLPGVWVHHRVVFTPNNGKLSYLYNGVTDNETWATHSHLPGSSILFFNVPENPRILLGGGFRGLMDQFLISNEPSQKLPDSKIAYSSGDIYTRTLALPQRAEIHSIDLDSVLPPDTAFTTEYRLSEIPFNDNTPPDVVPWKKYNDVNVTKNESMIARYIQIKLHLLADPTKNYSPLLKKIRINYTAFETPMKPIDFRAYSSNGDIIISLQQSINEAIEGYKLYLGTKPESFFGDPETGFLSPLMIPLTSFSKDMATNRLTYRIKGLTPTKLYYMKITSVTTNQMESAFSETVTSRVRTLE